LDPTALNKGIFSVSIFLFEKETGEENGGEKKKTSNSMFHQNCHQFRIEIFQFFNQQ